MTEPDLKPLPADIQDLLRSAPRPVPPAGFEAAVLTRLEASLDAAPGGTPANSMGAGGMTTATLSKMGTWGIPVSVFALLTGLAGGLLVGKNMAPPVSPAPMVELPQRNTLSVPEPPPGIIAPPVALEMPRPPSAPTPQRPRQASKVKAQPEPLRPERDLALADERGLIEIARTALARRDTARALEAIEDHANRFPRGQLVEERESLWVQALVNAGNVEGARRRATDFRRSFPESMLLPAVDAALEK